MNIRTRRWLGSVSNRVTGRICVCDAIAADHGGEKMGAIDFVAFLPRRLKVKYCCEWVYAVSAQDQLEVTTANIAKNFPDACELALSIGREQYQREMTSEWSWKTTRTVTRIAGLAADTRYTSARRRGAWSNVTTALIRATGATVPSGSAASWMQKAHRALLWHCGDAENSSAAARHGTRVR